MIKTIIFDFGDVFINLDKTATQSALSKFDKNYSPQKIQQINNTYEIGKLSTVEFINTLKSHFPKATDTEIIDAWNSILLDFPVHRLNFIKKLALEKQYQLVLLSNTNELHINWIKQNVSFYEEFKSCFDAFYLSHEITLRKPNPEIFTFVLNNHQIQPKETLFIDDTKENTDAAKALGIHIWNNNPKMDDIINLFTIKSDLF